MGWALLLSLLTNRQTNILLFGNSKPTFCAVLCNAGVGPCEPPFSLPAHFSYFRLQGRQRKTGKQEVEPGDCLLLMCLMYIPWQTTSISSTWSQHSASSGTPTTPSLGLGDPCIRWEFLRIQSQSPGFLQLLMAPLALLCSDKCASPPCLSISKDRNSFLRLLYPRYLYTLFFTHLTL